MIALLALVGVKLQIDSATELADQHSAREIYRGFLQLSIENPQHAQPQSCTGITGPDNPGYEAYLDYLLYTAEQVIALDPAWDPVMENWLQRHSRQLCSIDDLGVDTPQVAALITRLRDQHCADAPVCN
ncbi:hypothetical protein [Roseovarius sp. 2305UL8-3]|uniref:hypothetical protein n=1 Tax=Roseovarius conchicola TaxID=3121636 RepID=UPI003526C8B3